MFVVYMAGVLARTLIACPGFLLLQPKPREVKQIMPADDIQ